VKTPPLVFLSGEFSPFLHARQSPFDVEEVADAPDSLGFLQIISALPVPVIGLPWYQLTHLADAVLVAHEIGHDVERDLAMTGTIGEHELPKSGHEGDRAGWTSPLTTCTKTPLIAAWPSGRRSCPDAGSKATSAAPMRRARWQAPPPGTRAIPP
jgi:hypothetical protein